MVALPASSTQAVPLAPADGNAEAGPSSGPHHMRITSGGSISQYVRFALDFLQSNPNRPLILHTRPSSPSDRSTSTETPPSGRATQQPNQPRSIGTLQPCTLSTPKLISVVEIVKREYVALLNKSGKGKGKHKAVGIWQYTRSGLVDPVDLGLRGEGEGQAAGSGSLERVLSGKTKPKMTHYPYLEITLSTKPLELEKQSDTSCQYVLCPRYRPKRPASKATKELPDVPAVPELSISTMDDDALAGSTVIPRQVGNAADNAITADSKGNKETGVKSAMKGLANDKKRKGGQGDTPIVKQSKKVRLKA